MVLPVLDAATPRNCIYPARWSTLRNRIHSMHRSAEREMTRSGKDAFSVSDISKVLEPKVIRDHDVLAHQKLLFVSLACYLVHTISLLLAYRFRYRNVEKDRYNDSATKLPVLRCKRISLITDWAVRRSFSNVDTHRRFTSYLRIIWKIDSR